MDIQQANRIREFLRARLPLDGRKAKRTEMTANRFSIEILHKKKDYVREFLSTSKGSLDAPSIARIEKHFKLPPGSLSDPDKIVITHNDSDHTDQFRRVPAGSEFEPDVEFSDEDGSVRATLEFKRRNLAPGEVPERNVVAGLGQGGLADPVFVDGQVLDGVRAIWRVPEDYLRTELRAREGEVDILAVDGDSMQPTLLPGDRVIVNRSQTAPSPDGLFAIFDGVGISIKRLQVIKGSNPLQIRIISDNPQHATDIIEANDLHIIGRVICKITRL